MASEGDTGAGGTHQEHTPQPTGSGSFHQAGRIDWGFVVVKPPLEICFVGLILGQTVLTFRTCYVYSGRQTAHYNFPLWNNYSRRIFDGDVMWAAQIA